MKALFKKYGVIAIAALLAIILLCNCSGSKKSVAESYLEALLADFNAKKAVSLMSEGYRTKRMDDLDAETKRIMIKKLEKSLESTEENIIDKYGKKWKIKIEHIDTFEVSDSIYGSTFSVTYKGKGGLLGLSDKEDSDEITILLVKEGGKWKVYGEQ